MNDSCDYKRLEQAHEAAGVHMMQTSPRADELIACLEGEIAKRDEELAACRVAVENCELFRARIAELEARIVWLECEAQVNAAPVSEAKAHGVVMPEPELASEINRLIGLWDAQVGWSGQCMEELLDHAAKAATFIARLNAAPVQQVSVPECYARLLKHAFGMTFGEDWNRGTAAKTHRNKLIEAVFDCRHLLAAAPAAPAADAGIVDMYRHLQKVTPYRFKKIQDASITDGGDVMYFHKDRFDAALLADMAAHCAAKGVV